MAERKRIAVPISGIDTSTPDHSVEDGKCETLHNLRYTGGAWRNVRQLPEVLSVTENSEGVSSISTYKAWYHVLDSRFDYYGKKYDTRLEVIPLYTLDDTIANASNSQSGSKLYLKTSPYSAKYFNSNQYIGQNREIYDFEYILEDDVLSYGGETRNVYGAVQMPRHSLFSSLWRLSTKNNTQYTYLYAEKTPSSLAEGDAIYTLLSYSPYFNGQSEETPQVPSPIGKITGVVSRDTDTITFKVFTMNNVEENFTIFYNSITVLNYKLHAFAVPGTDVDEKNIFYRTYTNGSYGQYFFAINPEYTDYGTWLDVRAKITKEEKDIEGVVQSAEYSYNRLRRYPDEDFEVTTVSTDYTISYKHPIDEDGYITKQRKTIQNSDGTTAIAHTFSRSIIDSLGIKEEGSFDICNIDASHTYSISHFGRVLIITDHTVKQNRFYHFADNVYNEFSFSDLDVSISAEFEKKCCVSSDTANYNGKPEDGNSHLAIIQDKIIDNNGNFVWQQGNESSNAWRGEIGIFCAIRTKDGEIVKTTPIQIFNTSETINGSLRFEDDYIYPQDLNTGDTLYSGIRLLQNSLYLCSRINRRFVGSTDSYWIDSSNFSNLGIAKWHEATGATDAQRNALLYMLPYHVMGQIKYHISFNSTTINSLVDNVAIYCTRIHNSFVGSPTLETVMGHKLESETYVSPDNLFEDTYYLLESIDLKKFTSDGRTLDYTTYIDYEKLKNIVSSKETYKPNQTLETIFFEKSKEYNNRLHFIGVTYKPTLPHKETFILSSNDEVGDKCIIEYMRDEETYRHTFSSYDISGESDTFFDTDQKICISTPLNEATFNFGVISEQDEELLQVKRRLATCYSDLLGLSYIIGDARATRKDKGNGYYNSLRKYEAINAADAGPNITIPFSNTYSVDSNRVQVSALNNLFSLPNGVSYYIGTSNNSIIAVNSAAIEMSDSKFGEFPLYVFSDEGIFAMQSGKETLYSAIVPINYDKLINHNTLAVNGNLLYITKEGIKSLSSNSVSLLSESINDKSNTPPIVYLEKAQLYLHVPYNEIIIHNPLFDYAYIYSINKAYWYIRDFSGVKLDSNSIYLNKQIGHTASHTIFSLQVQEYGQSVPFSLTTRPIKLGSMELKRAETIIVRFESETEQTLNVTVEGSIDTQNWGELRKLEGVQTNKDIVIRRTPCSVKYLRFTIWGTATNDIRILALELEYYNRMLHRMR